MGINVILTTFVHYWTLPGSSTDCYSKLACYLRSCCWRPLSGCCCCCCSFISTHHCCSRWLFSFMFRMVMMMNNYFSMSFSVFVFCFYGVCLLLLWFMWIFDGLGIEVGMNRMNGVRMSWYVKSLINWVSIGGIKIESEDWTPMILSMNPFMISSHNHFVNSRYSWCLSLFVAPLSLIAHSFALRRHTCYWPMLFWWWQWHQHYSLWTVFSLGFRCW